MKNFKMVLIVAVMMTLSLQAFASGDGWITNYKDAIKIAKEKKIPILVDFSGSDWCGWCKKLDQEVFQKKEFKEYAKKNFVLLLLDFPRAGNQSAELKTQNKKLAQKFQVQGFPTILVLDSTGKKIAKGGYIPGGPKAFIKFLDGVKSNIKSK